LDANDSANSANFDLKVFGSGTARSVSRKK
jgi:hypothetical protein